MPGAFGGDYDEEQGIPEIDDESVDEESEEEEQEELEEQLRQQMEAEKKAKEHRINANLKKIEAKTKIFVPLYTPSDYNTIKSAIKNPKFQTKATTLLAKIAQQISAFWAKVMSAIAPALPYILIGALIIVAIIFVAVAIMSIFGALFGGSGDGMSSQFGASGKDFYGNRVIYRDIDQARVDILSGLVDYIDESIAGVPNGADYTLTININIPEDYDYKEFDETTFASEFVELYYILAGDGTNDGIVDKVYKLDNPDGTETGLVEQLDAIKYFGLNAGLNTEFSNLLSQYIVDNDIYTATPKTDETTIDPTTVEMDITNSINSYFAGLPVVRTEKLYIKDYIFSGDDGKMANISNQDYVAMIFMPRSNVTFTHLSFAVAGVGEEFKIYATQGDNSIDFGTKETVDEEKKAYTYLTGKNLNISASAFIDIDTNNLEFLSQGKSLFNIVRENESSYTTYLESSTTNDGAELLTAKMNGVVIHFENSEAFGFAEFETITK